MPNPQPTGTGQIRGLDDLQDAGAPLPSRPQRSAANDARYAVPCDHVEGHADGATDLSRNPFERF